MITLEKAKEKLPTKVYDEFENLYFISQEEDDLSPQWYTTRQMMQELLKEYNLDDKDPFDFGEYENE